MDETVSRTPIGPKPCLGFYVRWRLNVPPSPHNWIRFACHQNDVPELAQTIVIKWNRRFTRRLGDAIFNPITFQSRIRLSIPLWPIASEQDRYDTVVHEACHLIVWHQFGLLVKAHGSEWQVAMKNCGVQPLRTHEVDRTGLARRQRLFILKDCPNEMKCRMGVREFNQIQKGTVMECKICGLVVKKGTAIELDK